MNAFFCSSRFTSLLVVVCTGALLIQIRSSKITMLMFGENVDKYDVMVCYAAQMSEHCVVRFYDKSGMEIPSNTYDDAISTIRVTVAGEADMYLTMKNPAETQRTIKLLRKIK